MNAPHFLTKESVLALHAQQLRRHGGQAGLGDAGLLDSALFQPQNTWLYDVSADLFDVAAAYTFHLAKNHAFNDGNKRIALHAALAFLEVNGTGITAAPDALYEAVIRVTTSQISKGDFAGFLREHRRDADPA